MRYALGCHFKLWSNKSVIGAKSDEIIAYAYEKYFRTYGVGSEDIVKKAVYNPRSTKFSQRTVTG